MRKLASLVLGALFGVALADKDDSYYVLGAMNPNINEKMYWKDAENVLQDLSSFDYLYVEFHHCAWTRMRMEESNNDVEENDYWYMGKIPPMGANVAYSLYGVLKNSTSSGCGKDTFINSFYTNDGFTNFTQAMYYANASGFSESYDYSADCYGGFGVGCDSKYGFAMHAYGGDECDPQNATGVLDKLSDLNEAMEGVQCVTIYDSSEYSGYMYGTPLELLGSSSACFYQNFFSPEENCPDPYGWITKYQENFEEGMQNTKRRDPYHQYRWNIEKGKKMLTQGEILLAFAVFIFILDVFTRPKTKSKEMSDYSSRSVATNRTDRSVKELHKIVTGLRNYPSRPVTTNRTEGLNKILQGIRVHGTKKSAKEPNNIVHGLQVQATYRREP